MNVIQGNKVVNLEVYLDLSSIHKYLVEQYHLSNFRLYEPHWVFADNAFVVARGSFLIPLKDGTEIKLKEIHYFDYFGWDVFISEYIAKM